MKWIASFLILISIEAYAAERLEFYQGVRQLGMGGVGIGVVNDETALVTNPAGLGKLRNYFVTVFDPELTQGSNNLELIPKGKPLQTANPQGLLDVLNQAKDKDYYTKVQLFPSIVFPNFGLGVLAKYEISGRVDPTGTDYYYSYRNDFAAVMAFNFRLFDGVLKLGVNGRYVNRVEAIGTFAANSTDLTLKTMGQQGTGLASDVGIILTAPITFLPSVAAVVRDVGHTKFNLGGGVFTGYTGEPQKVDQTVGVAVSLFPIFSNHVRGSFSIEARDVLNASEEEDKMKLVHAGFEINAYDMLFVRAGMNQRYWTAGAEISMSFYQFQFATYGEEIGTDAVPRQDRRYVGKAVFRF